MNDNKNKTHRKNILAGIDDEEVNRDFKNGTYGASSSKDKLLSCYCEGFSKTTRLFKYIFNGGFKKKSEAFSKITRLFEDIFNRIETFFE
jgi:hypothetical protein